MHVNKVFSETQTMNLFAAGVTGGGGQLPSVGARCQAQLLSRSRKLFTAEPPLQPQT